MRALLSREELSRLQTLLRARFHVEALHPFQSDVTTRLLQGQSVLAVVATGAGKSLCYQLPSLFWDQGVLVVSPLVALMHQQAEKMRQLDIPAYALTGQLDEGQQRDILGQWRSGFLRLLYVAPERLGDQRFREALIQVPPKLLVVDEAHCISEWGYDFRPEYRRIRLFREYVGQPPLLALTATATERVKADIRWQLTVDGEPFALVEGPVDRPNIFLAVEMVLGPQEQRRQVAQLAREGRGGVIIYSASRKGVEQWAKYLTDALQEPVFAYHAGMQPEQRRAIERDFAEGSLRVVAATTAFGMGIDRGDIGRVIHVTVPASLDAYCQEIGRAGRDGRSAEAIMVIQAIDLYRREQWLRDDRPDSDWIRGVLERIAAGPLQRWVLWQLDERDARTEVVLAVLEDRGLIATASAPRGIRVMRQSGDVLSEADGAIHRLQQFWQQRHALFEEMARYIESRECRRATILRYYGQSGLSPAHCCDQCRSGGGAAVAKRPDGALVEQLRKWRAEEAARLSVESYIVLSDRDLMGIAVKRPQTLQALGQCRGMGPKRMARYGDQLLALLQPYGPAGSESLPAVDQSSARDRAIWHFQAGTPWTEVADQAGRSQSTIREYLVGWIAAAPESEWRHYVGQWVSPADYRVMAATMASLGTERLRPLYDALAGHYSYDQWHVARAMYENRTRNG